MVHDFATYEWERITSVLTIIIANQFIAISPTVDIAGYVIYV